MEEKNLNEVNDSVLIKNAPLITIETIYREAQGLRSGSYYKDEVLEAFEGKDGELHFEYAKPDSYEKTAKTNKTQYLTYSLQHGAKNVEIFGVNWDNVKSISGKTFNLRQIIKQHGFRWDGQKWIKIESCN